MLKIAPAIFLCLISTLALSQSSEQMLLDKIRIQRAQEREEMRQRKIIDDQDLKKDPPATTGNKLAEQRPVGLLDKCLSTLPMAVCEITFDSFMKQIGGANSGIAHNALMDYFAHMQFSEKQLIKKINVYVAIKNNLPNRVKDVQLYCMQVTDSGTTVSKSIETVFQLWQPDETRTINIEQMPTRNATSLKCEFFKEVRMR